MFEHILLPIDGSLHSLRSVDIAVKIAKASNAKVDLLYVIEGSMSKFDVINNDNPVEVEKKRKDRMQPAQEKLKEAKVEFESLIIHGEPGSSIVNVANQSDYDCLVIGSRGLNRFQTFMLGSVSYKVAKLVKCPVIIVK
ncbi:universal stress protein [Bacillus solitudinis]|uniref:universal stress protein n=1 Tax=Bacillus solitudinis TaxID=2014074 RepID=UPI000C23A1BF|nr:universal stress protein [Bacillus solitudinis]